MQEMRLQGVHISAQAWRGVIVTITAVDLKPLMYEVPEVLVMLRMSRTQFYAQVNAGRLRIVKQGRSTRVTANDLATYVRLLEQEAEDAR